MGIGGWQAGRNLVPVRSELVRLNLASTSPAARRAETSSSRRTFAMTSGTKIFLALFAILIGVLVLYYGVWQKAQPLGPASANVAGSAITNPAEPSPAPGKVLARRNTDDGVSMKISPTQTPARDRGAGFLTKSVEVPALPLLAADTSLDALTIAAPASAPAANTPLAIDTTINPAVSPAEVQAASPGPSAPPSPAPPPMIEYTIKAGDTGVSIAKDWFGDGNKWTLISKANPWVDFNRLKIGDKLKLPPKDATEASIAGSGPITAVKPTAKPVTMGDKTTYVVQPGDTLIKIARKHFGSDAKWELIYEANKAVIGSDPADLKVGMKLTLPAKK
jgi:LysM repeat protein